MANEQRKEYWNPETKTLEHFEAGAAIPAGYRQISVQNTPETALPYVDANNPNVIKVASGGEVFYYVHYEREEVVTLSRITPHDVEKVRDANGRPQDEKVQAPEPENLFLQQFTHLESGATCWYVGERLTEEEIGTYGLRLNQHSSIRRSGIPVVEQNKKKYTHDSDAQKEKPITFYFTSKVKSSVLTQHGFTPAGLKGADNLSNLNEANNLSNTFWHRYSALPTRRKVYAALAITLSLALIVLAAIPAHILAGTFLDWAAPLAPLLGGTGFLGLFFTVLGHWIDIALESKEPAELGKQLKSQSAFQKAFRYAVGFLFIVGAALLLASFVAPLLGAPAAFSAVSRIFGPALMLGILISIFVSPAPSGHAKGLVKTLYTQWQNMHGAVRYIPAAIILLAVVAFMVLNVSSG